MTLIRRLFGYEPRASEYSDRGGAIQIAAFWPAWAIALAMKLNEIHAEQRRYMERIMQEIEQLRQSQETLKKEVGEAVAKMSETNQKLAEAVQNIGDAEQLKQAIRDAAANNESTAKTLNDAFGTDTFQPSGL